MKNQHIRRKNYIALAVIAASIIISVLRVDSMQSAQALYTKSLKAIKVKLKTVSRHTFMEWAFAKATLDAIANKKS
jgi:hypothetical protein